MFLYNGRIGKKEYLCNILYDKAMFGRRKTNKLIEDIDRYFDLIDQSVLVFKDGVRNYLYSNKNKKNTKNS